MSDLSCPRCGALTERLSDPDPFAEPGPERCPNCGWVEAVL